MGAFNAFSNETSSSNITTTNNQWVTTTNTTNVDQSQVQTNSQEISNSGNTSWSNVTDSGVKALDSFNKNVQYSIGGNNYGKNPSDMSGFGGMLDWGNFFGGGSATGSTQSNNMNKFIILAIVGVVVWFFFRKR